MMEHTCNPRTWETWQEDHRFKGSLNYTGGREGVREKILTDTLLLINGAAN